MYDSDYICKAVDAYKYDKHMYFILEKMTDSMEVLSYTCKVSMELKALKYACFSMFKALEYIHKHDLIHRDLKSENMLFNSEGEIKVCDFGQSFQMTEEN